jgi:hypothetical protein
MKGDHGSLSPQRTLPRSGVPGGYEETRSALTGRLVMWCVIYPASTELLFLVLAITVNVNWSVAMGAASVPAMIGAGFAYRNWPTGIRIDESGITIGAIRSRRARFRRPTVYHQSWGLYTCPWTWIQDAQVMSSPEAIRTAAKGHHTLNNQWGGNLSMTRCDIGVMTAPSRVPRSSWRSGRTSEDRRQIGA